MLLAEDRARFRLSIIIPDFLQASRNTPLWTKACLGATTNRLPLALLLLPLLLLLLLLMLLVRELRGQKTKELER